MMNINSLLNPPPSPNRLPPCSSFNPTPSPSHHSEAYTAPTTPSTRILLSPMASPRPRLPKDAAVFTLSATNGQVNYAPYECTERHAVLSPDERHELKQQHRRFRLFPSGGEERLIGEYVRRVPYNSDKKGFSFGKTGREGFELFQYTFVIPNGMTNAGKEWVVMWDYQVGLVRITPFFKACGYAKTQPNKVINANKGLRELSHGITGGSIAAQGYWMPYGCARAICATFCWDLRWALTPIFGPSFLKDCIPKGGPDFENWIIDPEVIRVCTLETQSWRQDTVSRTGTPMSGIEQPAHYTSAPRSEHLEPKNLRPRASRPNLRVDSPFDSSRSSSSFDSNDRYEHDSPSISPKTTSSSWTSINHNRDPPPSPFSLTGTPTPATRDHSQLIPKLISKNKGKSRATTPKSPHTTTKPTHKRAYPTSAPASDTEGRVSDTDMASTIKRAKNTPGHNSRTGDPSTAPPGRFRAREYNAAVALLQLAKEDVEKGGKVALY